MAYSREDYEHALGRAYRAGDQAAVQDLIQRAVAEYPSEPAGLLVNLGAGVDTFIQGAKQLIGKGPSDEELREKRRIDAKFAASTPGGSFAQIVGEAAPSLLLPGGTGARVLQGALRLGRGAFQTGRTALPLAMGGSALEGAGAAAFMPTLSDESKLENLGIGTAFGAGAPLLPKALGATWRTGRNLADRAIASVPGAYGERAAARLGTQAAEAGLRRAEVPLDPARYAAQDYQPNTLAPREFAPSTAAAYHQTTPQLANVERASRQTDPSWAARDADEAAKRWEYLDTSLRGERDVEAAITRANAMTPPYNLAGPKLWETNMAGFTRDLENLVGTPAYIANPKFQNAVDFLRKRIEMGTITPETMHGFRKTLAEGLAGPPGVSDAAIRAGRSDPAIQGLITRIDSVMEGSIPAKNRGAWGDWRANYSANLAEGEAAKAEHQMRRSFVDEHGRSLTGTGTTPDITIAKLQREADAARRVESGPRTGQQQLSPHAEQAVSDILENLRATGILKTIEKAATSGGGSATALNFAAMGAGGVLSEMMADNLSVGAVGGLALSLSRHNVAQAQRAIMSRILQDPAEFRRFVAASAQRAQQLASRPGVASRGRYGGAAAAATLPVIDPDEQQR